MILDRPGRRRRRVVAAGVAILAVADFVEAAAHRSIARVGWLSLDLGGSTTRLFRYVLLLAGLTMVSVVRGLLRGKRTAWLIATIGATVSLLGHHVVKADAIGIALAVGTMAALAVNARLFRARPDPALARESVAWLFAGLVGAYVYGVAGLYLLDAQFRHATTLRQSVGASARLLFLLPVSTIAPRTHHGQWFIESVRVMVTVVLLGGVIGLLRPVRGRVLHDRDLDHVALLLDRYGDTALASFHLLEDKQHLFAADGNAFIGYKVVRSVAVSLGGPIGAPDSKLDVVGRFVERCELNGWIPAFHQVDPEGVALLQQAGLRAVKIGEEAVIDLAPFSLAGSHFKSIRSKIAKMEREGWTVEELRSPIDASTMHRLRALSDAWLEDGGHRERTFTLGQFDEDYLNATRVLVARDGTGRIQGFTNLIPVYRSDEGNFDLMRRDPSCRLPVMDLLFVAMIGRFREEGRVGMNLGLAPLANVDGDGIADRALRVLYDHGSRAFNFAGLYEYKDKWQPRWEPRYLAYRVDAELPEIAFGVSRAGELPNSTSGRLESASGLVGAAARGVVAAGRRIPFTLAIIGAILAVEVASAFDTDSFRTFQNALQYNWSDLSHRHDFYRLFTALLVQDGPGLRVGVVVLAPMLAAAESVLRTRRAAVVFFAGDLCSSIAVLAGARVASSLGSSAAQRVLVERDGGVSSAVFAVIMAGCLQLRQRRPRALGVGLLSCYLVISAVIERRLFSLQHLAAALVGAALSWTFSHRAAPSVEGTAFGSHAHDALREASAAAH